MTTFLSIIELLNYFYLIQEFGVEHCCLKAHYKNRDDWPLEIVKVPEFRSVSKGSLSRLYHKGLDLWTQQV